MARSTVTCTDCGVSTFTVHGRSRADADRQAKRLEMSWSCRECKDKAAAERAAEAGLPTLKGTEKQIIWALKLREHRLNRVELFVSEAFDGLGFSTYSPDAAELNAILDFANEVGEETVRAAATRLPSIDDAKFWIDTREDLVADVLAEAWRRIEAEDKAASPEAEIIAGLERDAKAEATLRPPSPVSEVVAEVAHVGDLLQVRFPERSEPFRQVVKALGYRWSQNVWIRDYDALTMGAAADRVGETAHRLLAAGFVVCVMDDAARAKAVDGSFAPEVSRWISALVSGEHAGKFQISWSRDDDCYAAFKSLPGSRYCGKGLCVVVASARDAVLDFAEKHGFSLTPGAQALADKVLADREKGVVVTAASPRGKPEPIEMPARRPERLEVPAEVEVDSELVDHD